MSLPIRWPDPDRAAVLGAYGINDGDGVDIFRRYARLACTIAGTSMGAVSFLDADQKWRKSVIGLQTYDRSRCGRFCAQTMLADKPLLVVDASRDPRFAESPAVPNAPGLRFYLGAPLRKSNGDRIGAVGTFERAPRTATPEMVARLVDLAEAVGTTLELYNSMQEVKLLALTDGLTGLPNRIQLFQTLKTVLDAPWRDVQPLTLLYIDCDNFKLLNDELGHLTGDQMLQALALTLRDGLRPGDVATRLGGDEFVIVMPQTGARDAWLAAGRIRSRGTGLMAARAWPTTLSIGAVTFMTPPANVESALSLADQAMYGAKQVGGDRVRCVVIGGQPGAGMPQATFDKALL